MHRRYSPASPAPPPLHDTRQCATRTARSVVPLLADVVRFSRPDTARRCLRRLTHATTASTTAVTRNITRNVDARRRPTGERN